MRRSVVVDVSIDLGALQTGQRPAQRGIGLPAVEIGLRLLWAVERPFVSRVRDGLADRPSLLEVVEPPLAEQAKAQDLARVDSDTTVA